jgi:hypothetical protein
MITGGEGLRLKLSCILILSLLVNMLAVGFNFQSAKGGASSQTGGAV